MKILIIEDNYLIGDGIKTAFTQLKCTVDWFQDGVIGENAAYDAIYDAIILDLGLPRKDGMSVLKSWRKNGLKTPVLILTAKGTTEERIEGLQNGADDYLPKPFSVMELYARLQAISRRSAEVKNPIIKYKNIELDSNFQKVTKDNQEIKLTSHEYKIIKLFLTHQDQILSKSYIENKIYNWDYDLAGSSIDVHMHNIRKKIGKGIIETIYAQGYRLKK
ncbi:MAG: response regulator transcription factor [Psittacicella sp.]